MLSTLLGNADTTGSLTASLQSGKLPHAILLAGPEGCGRGYAARCLAADFLFPGGGPGGDAVMRNESPEVLLVQGEGKSGNIPVARIREIRSDIFRSALSAAGRVVWIRDAHRMEPPAYNALLKVLEEPPADALFILTSHDAAALPATIRSRCALYPLAPVSLAACQSRLQKEDNADAALAGMLAAVYGGRIGMGLRVLHDEGRAATLQDALKLAAAAGKGDAYSMLALFAKYEGRAEGERDRRDALLSDTADVLACSLRGLTAEGLPAIPPGTAAALVPAVHTARGQLRRNAAAKITFAALSVRLQRAYTAQ